MFEVNENMLAYRPVHPFGSGYGKLIRPKHEIMDAPYKHKKKVSRAASSVNLRGTEDQRFEKCMMIRFVKNKMDTSFSRNVMDYKVGENSMFVAFPSQLSRFSLP